MRSFPIGRYLIFYRIVEETLQVAHLESLRTRGDSERRVVATLWLVTRVFGVGQLAERLALPSCAA